MRGADEVGGSCVELEASGGDRLVLDLGLPLATAVGEEVAPPPVAGLDGGDPSLRGLLVSHGHPDHYGLLGSISPQVPIYLGEAAARILAEASFFTPLGLDRATSGTLVDRQPLRLGAFTITPYLVDHSAFDSYALLVEADGRRLFYTADLRGHGRKGGLFERLLTDPPPQVNSLLLEGTTVGRPPVGATLREEEIEERCSELFGESAGMALACFSPQNVDRLVSVYRAAIRSGRRLVLDLYAAAVATATGRETIPQADWAGVRVYVPQTQRVRVKRSGQFWRVDELGSSRIYAKELAEDPGRWVTCFRPSMGPELARAGCLDGARGVWLMWPGYLDGVSGGRVRDSFARLGIDLEVIHASGHASVQDLRRLAAAIDADKVVPIHTDAPQRYFELFDRVETRVNREWWEV